MTAFAYFIGLIVVSYCFLALMLTDDEEHGMVFGEPILKQSGFQLDTVVDGLSRPTGITFLGPDDFLVIEEDTGKMTWMFLLMIPEA